MIILCRPTEKITVALQRRIIRAKNFPAKNFPPLQKNIGSFLAKNFPSQESSGEEFPPPFSSEELSGEEYS
jgi:hypothetical protein